MWKWYYGPRWWGKGRSQIILHVWNTAIPGLSTLLKSSLTAPYPSLPQTINCFIQNAFCPVPRCTHHLHWYVGSVLQYEERGLENNTLCNLGQKTSTSIDFPTWKMKLICLPLKLNGLTYVYALRKSVLFTTHIVWWTLPIFMLCCKKW